MSADNLLSPEPIENQDEDLLDWNRYAKLIANAIRNSDVSENSQVIALHGNWGSGKSSLKNLALRSLGSEWTHRTLEFSPWIVVGRENIHDTFFRELAHLSGIHDSKNKNLPTKITDWSLAISSANLAITAGAYGILYSHGLIPGDSVTHPVALVTSAKTALSLTTFFDKTVSFLKQLVADKKEAPKEFESLMTKQKNLRDEFKTLENPVLIVLDDLDRLTPAELRAIFQTIKANCNFPNVIFLLLYQRDVVEKALGQFSGSTDGTVYGRDFLEKIVQISLVVPQIPLTSLNGILRAEVDRQFARQKFKPALREHVYLEMITRISPFFESLRQVQRYCKNLEFVFGAFSEAGNYVINPCDVAVFEAIRMFEPELHKAMGANYNWLLYGGNTDEKQILLDAVSVKSREEQVQSLFLNMMPATTSANGGVQHRLSQEDVKEKRIFVYDNFPNYYALASLLSPAARDGDN